MNGIIDENTLIWGQGLADWLPVKNVRTLVPQIRTVEVQVATWMKKTDCFTRDERLKMSNYVY